MQFWELISPTCVKVSREIISQARRWNQVENLVNKQKEQKHTQNVNEVMLKRWSCQDT